MTPTFPRFGVSGHTGAIHIDQINQTGQWRTLQDPVLLDFLRGYAAPLHTLVFLIVLLVVSPLATTDRVNQLPPLQASTRTGRRRLLAAQLAATLAVSITLAAAVVALTSLPLGRLSIGEFWNTPIHSFTDNSVIYPAGTLGQHCLALAGTILLTGLTAGLAGFTLSRLSPTYPTLAIGLVATLALAMWTTPLIWQAAFSYNSLPATLTTNPWSPAWIQLGTTLTLLTIATTTALLHPETH